MDWEWIYLFGGICVLTGEWEKQVPGWWVRERGVCRQYVCFHNFKSVIWTDLEHFESAFVVLLAINSSGSLLQKLCREGDSVSETDLHSAQLSSLLEAFILVGRTRILQLVLYLTFKE